MKLRSWPCAAAWNVLSDPFQRQRYDAQLEAGAEPSGDVELVDDDNAPQSSGAELTGWRKLLAPPPPKDAGAGKGNSNGNGKGKGKGPGAAASTATAVPAPSPPSSSPRGCGSPSRECGAWRCCSTSRSSSSSSSR